MKSISRLIAALSLLLIVTTVSHGQNKIQDITDYKSLFEIITPLVNNGNKIKFNARGHSMEPTIMDKDDVTIRKYYRDILPYDIVVYQPDQDEYRLNRIVSINADNTINLSGDSTGDVGTYDRSCILALVESVETQDGIIYHLDTPEGRTLGEKVARTEWPDNKFTQKELLKVLPSIKGQITDTEGTPFYPVGQYSFNEFLVLNENSIVVKNSQGALDFSTYLSVNSSALYLIYNLKGKAFSANTMTKLITEKYEVSYEIANRDCVSILSIWYKIGLVHKL